MAKRANRSCGGKNVSKLMLKEASADLEVALRSINCDNCEVDLSEEEENCENLTVVCEDKDVSKLAVQSLPIESNSALRKEDKEVSFGFLEVEFVNNSGVVEFPVKVAQKSVAQDWRQ
jgi:hypothetical protein